MGDKSSVGKRSLTKVAEVLPIVVGLALLLGGGCIFCLNYTKTDPEGYALSNTLSINTTACAFVLWLDREPDSLGRLKFLVTSTDTTRELFVGYAEETATSSYIGGIEYANPTRSIPGQIYGWGVYYAKLDWTGLVVAGQAGSAPSRPPTTEAFWIQKLQTGGTTALYWEPVTDTSAPRTLIAIMNSDGSPGIRAEITLGYRSPLLPWIPYLLMPVGVLVGAMGFILLKRR